MSSTLFPVLSTADDRYGTGTPHVIELDTQQLHVIPVIFVPGVMGTRLKNKRGGKVWDPDNASFMLFEYGLWEKDAAAKKKKMNDGAIYDPAFLSPYNDDIVHNAAIATGLPIGAVAIEDFITRGDELSTILIDLGLMRFVFNCLKDIGVIDRNKKPEDVDDWKGWADLEEFVAKRQQAEGLLQKVGAAFPPDTLSDDRDFVEKLATVVERGWGGLYWDGYSPIIDALRGSGDAPGLLKKEVQAAVERHAERAGQPLSEELITRLAGRVQFPVYGFGYNWTSSCRTSGEKLAVYIDEIIERYQHLSHVMCEDVILVTHSMGGLVGRSACGLHGAEDRVRGVIHGVQPTLGAAAMYWRAKAGFPRAPLSEVGKSASAGAWFKPKGDDPYAAEIPITTQLKGAVMAGVLGADGHEVTALAGSLPGLLELAPSHEYRTNDGDEGWIKVIDETGKAPEREVQHPMGNVYEDTYKTKLQGDDFWAMVKPELLVPEAPDDEAAVQQAWKQYCSFIDQARAFHEALEGYAHPQTFNFYGGGPPVRKVEDDHVVTTATCDTVVYRIKPFTWKDSIEGEAEDIINRALKGEVDPEATVESLGGSLGTPEQSLRDVEERVSGSLDGGGSLQPPRSDALGAGVNALEVGLQALEAAQGAFKTARSGFQEVLAATRQAVAAAQQVIAGCRKTLQATHQVLQACMALVDRLGETIDTFEETLKDILKTCTRHLSEETAEVIRDAARGIIEQARKSLDPIRGVVAEALSAVGKTTQQLARAAETAMKAGKDSFAAGEGALKDALSTGDELSENIQAATRKALEAAAEAFDAGRQATEATLQVLTEAQTGLRTVTDAAADFALQASEAAQRMEDALTREQQTHPQAMGTGLLRALRDLLRTVYLMRVTIDVAHTTTHRILGAARRAEEALHAVAQPVTQAFTAAGNTVEEILAASKAAMDQVVKRGHERLDQAAHSLHKGRAGIEEHVLSAVNEAREGVDVDWEAQDQAIQRELATGSLELEEALHHTIARIHRVLQDSTWRGIQACREAFARSLSEVIDAVHNARVAVEQTVGASEDALEAARRVTDVGADALNALLHATEETVDKASHAGQHASDTVKAAGDLPRSLDNTAMGGGDRLTGSIDQARAQIGLSDEPLTTLPAYPEKYQDGRAHLHYQRGGFTAYFSTDDGTVLKAVLAEPDGEGDETVPVYSARALVAKEKPIATYDSDFKPRQQESLRNELMHEPAYKDEGVQEFTAERVVHLFAASVIEKIVTGEEVIAPKSS